MGWNTTVVVLNDALHQIETDPNFGKNLVKAIAEKFSNSEAISVRAGDCGRAAQVVETHHASDNVAVIVGGNFGSILGVVSTGIDVTRGFHNEEAVKIANLKVLADKLGYNLVKKRKKK